MASARPPPAAPQANPGVNGIGQPLQKSRRQISLTNIVIPALKPFKAQQPQETQPYAHHYSQARPPQSLVSPNSIKRKPVGLGLSAPQGSAAIAASASAAAADRTKKPGAFVPRHGLRTGSISSVQSDGGASANGLGDESATPEDFQPRDLDEYPRGTTPNIPNAKWRTSHNRTDTEEPTVHIAQLQIPLRPDATRSNTDVSDRTVRPGQASSSTVNLVGREQQEPSTTSMNEGDVATLNFPPPPKSPSSGGWFWGKSKDKPPASPSTTFSESLSPLPSPNINKPLPGLLSPTQNRSSPMQKTNPSPLSLDISRANNVPSSASTYFAMPATPAFSTANAAQEQIDELQRELREVSSELANSIRREMELEDELDRWKAENASAGDAGKRTSDYYSDSGASSVRLHAGDSEQKLEELERSRRKVEQDKANLKVEMGQRLQTEMQRRKEIEAQFTSFQEQSNAGVSPERQRELENALQQAQRKLAEERQSKENYEDLLTAMKGEVEGLRNERDNLKDEIVPALKARVDGLEADVSKRQSEAYDHTKMQQELDKLRSEKGRGIGSINEESDIVSPMSGLSRSKSMARGQPNGLARAPSLKGRGRSDSLKGNRPPESPSSLGDSLKDIEEQRDALHSALKSLLSRQESQQREFSRRLKTIQEERDKAVSSRPRGTSFQTDVAKLKDEMNGLRRRADDALEQKWQCEKGLSGLRMDLDRAHQETSDLRGLLQQHDIPLPASQFRLARSDSTTSLDKAYKELRTTHALSLARVMEMENESGLGAASAEAQRTLQLLKQSISDAEAERDAAQKEAESYRVQARALNKPEVKQPAKNQSAALFQSAARMDELAAQVEKQLTANRDLKARLAEAVGRGERDQKISASRIVELQSKLRELEDRVTVAQQHSEEVVATHESEVRQLKETHSSQLQRLKSHVSSPGRFSFLQNSGVSVNGSASPPLMAARATASGRSRKGSSVGMTMAEASKTEELEMRVRQLERALKDAESEMEEVVGRMNMAQIEVAELQAARDEATMQTRRLQAQIAAEREKVQKLMG